MTYDRQTVIDWAKAQVGYKETPDNINKYAEYLDKLKGFYNGPKNGYAWCDVFVDCGFVVCYGREAAQFLLCQPDYSCGAGCQFSAAYFNAKGQFYKTGPQPGDQIFFGNGWQNIWHTGLVVAVNGNIVTTIEGNTSDMVAERRYSLNDPNIWGYGRPEWGEEEKPAEQDSTPSKWAKDAVEWAVDNGIMVGSGDDLMLRQPVTREQFCVMLYRFFNKIKEE